MEFCNPSNPNLSQIVNFQNKIIKRKNTQVSIKKIAKTTTEKRVLRVNSCFFFVCAGGVCGTVRPHRACVMGKPSPCCASCADVSAVSVAVARSLAVSH